MFLSGVVFSLDRVPAPYADWLAWNPVLLLLEALRGVLLQGLWPDWALLVRISVLALVLAGLGLLSVQRLAPRYPKLAV
jgi:lipopolysaccharide transport system permease protein